MGEHRDDCEYWEQTRSPLFVSSDSIEKVTLDYDRHCDLIVVGGYYDSMAIPSSELLDRLNRTEER